MKLAFSKKNLWEGLPQSIKSGAGRVIGLFPPERILGRSFRKCRELVLESSTWSQAQVRSHQIGRLKRILLIANEISDYYRESFMAAGFNPQAFSRFGDLEQLPLIDKHIMNQVADSMSTIDRSMSDTDYVSTGGSSGEPLHFYIGSNRSAIEYAHLTEAWSRVDYSLTKPQAVFRGQVISTLRERMYYYYDPLLRRHYYSNFHMDDQSMETYIEHIRTIGDCYIHTYPSSLNILVRFLKRSGLTPLTNIRGLLVGSENVYSQDRASAEDIFGCRYFSWYGHSEKLVFAAECEYSTNYHIYPTYGFCELIGENGKVVTTPGERGEIVGTGFINEIMPFIRYRTGDYATYVGESCEHCGRNHTIICDVSGHRLLEMLVAKDSALIPWVAVNVHDDTFDNVLQFQFVQKEIGRATLKIVPVRNTSDVDITKIKRHLTDKLGNRLVFDIEIVESIELTDSGKSVYVDQKLDIEGLLKRGE